LFAPARVLDSRLAYDVHRVVGVSDVVRTLVIWVGDKRPAIGRSYSVLLLHTD
jgi:hypothetical protein